MPKRRVSRKRRSYKGMRFRRVGRGPVTRIRRASVVRKRRRISRKGGMVSYRKFTRGFPTASARGPLVIAEQRHPEREYIRMVTQARNQGTRAALTGTRPNINSSMLFFISMTDLENPGSISPVTWGTTFARVNGWAQQTALYRYFQPRGCRMTLYITRQVDGPLTTMDNVIVEVCVAPVSNDQVGALATAYPFNALKKLPGARTKRIVYDANLVGMKASAHWKMFSSQQKMEAE